MIVTGLEAVALAAQALAWVIEQVQEADRVVDDLQNLTKDIVNAQVEGGGGTFDLLNAVGRGVGIPGFAEGGVVPGPVGQPQLAVVHGGEEIRTPEQQGGGDREALVSMFADVMARAMAQVSANTTNAMLQEYTDDVLGPALS